MFGWHEMKKTTPTNEKFIRWKLDDTNTLSFFSPYECGKVKLFNKTTDTWDKKTFLHFARCYQRAQRSLSWDTYHSSIHCCFGSSSEQKISLKEYQQLISIAWVENGCFNHHRIQKNNCRLYRLCISLILLQTKKYHSLSSNAAAKWNLMICIKLLWS